MGFFAAVVFLPRWFQFVHGNSATESGYQILPLLLGLIVRPSRPARSCRARVATRR